MEGESVPRCQIRSCRTADWLEYFRIWAPRPASAQMVMPTPRIWQRCNGTTVQQGVEHTHREDVIHFILQPPGQAVVKLNPPRIAQAFVWRAVYLLGLLYVCRPSVGTWVVAPGMSTIFVALGILHSRAFRKRSHAASGSFATMI